MPELKEETVQTRPGFDWILLFLLDIGTPANARAWVDARHVTNLLFPAVKPAIHGQSTSVSHVAIIRDKVAAILPDGGGVERDAIFPG